MRLNVKILLAFLPGVLLAAAIIARVVQPSLEEALRDSTGKSHLLLAQQTLNSVCHLLNEKYNDIQMITREVVFLDFLRGRRDERLAAAKLGDWLELSGPWDLLAVLDTGGAIRLSSEKSLVGQGAYMDEEDAKAFYGALKGSIYYSDVVFSKRMGRPTVIFAAPILSVGEPLRPVKGVVLGHFSWSAVAEILRETSEVSHDRIYNGRGVLIASDEPAEASGILQPAAAAGEGLRRALQGLSGIVEEGPRGERRLTAYAAQRAYVNYKSLGWALTSEAPARLAFAPVERFVDKLLSVLAACIGLSFLTAMVIVLRTVSAPISRLTGVVRGVARGDWTGRAPASSRDEIGELGEAFNRMVGEVLKATVSKEFFNRLLDGIQDEIIVTDAAGFIFLVNPALVQRLGYEEKELIGMPAAELFADDAGVFAGPWKSRSTHFLTKSKERIPVLLSTSAFKSPDGTSGLIGVAKDISELRRLEARMQQTEKLSAVGQLAAGVAHEINNPLGVILGFAEGMSRSTGPGDPFELPVKSIQREALRCKALVQDLLTFARTTQSERGALDLNSTVEEIVGLVSAQAKMTRTSLDVSLMKSRAFVMGNKNQLQQVVLNLAKNALDAMPNGGTLSISTELLEDRPNSWVCLKVSDTGTGIPDEIRSKIFEPFFTTKPVGQGTGLGLSLINEIVRKHSGDIEVSSRPGRTTFTVRLPTASFEEPDQRPAGPLRVPREAMP